MNLQRVAAFSRGEQGGNPAGVALLTEPLSDKDMARIAAEVGYSETAFAYPLSADRKHWRVRYFSPESEVPFCGHATVALGSVLGETYGLSTYSLKINQADIEVTASQTEAGIAAELTSPQTYSRALSEKELSETLALLGLQVTDLDEQLPPAKNSRRCRSHRITPATTRYLVCHALRSGRRSRTHESPRPGDYYAGVHRRCADVSFP